MWIQEKNPELFRQASRFITAKEYVISHLTGQYLVDYSLAAGSGLLNTHDLKWNTTSLELARITPDQLSPIQDPRLIISGLNPEYAKEMGVNPDTPLVLGSSDATNSNLGAGAIKPGQATLMVGTSGALRIISPKPVLDPLARSWCYAIDPSHWLIGGAINNGGLALSWLRDVLNRTYSDAQFGQRISFEDLINLASEAGVGAGGLMCLPFLAGERSPHWNLDARALFFGMTLHHDIRHLSRALLEGIAFQFKNVYEILIEIGIDISQIRASGGLANSEIWLQIIASTLGREILVTQSLETSSMGAAFWAMHGNDSFPNLEIITGLITMNSKYQANPEEVDIYERLFNIYNEIYEKISGSFHKLARFQEALRKK